MPGNHKWEDLLSIGPENWSLRFNIFKIVFDYSISLLMLPIIATFALFLLVANPFWNPGPLFFKQDRMGRHGKKFVMWKFRTMVPSDIAVRSHDAPVEEDRITRLGGFLRKSRIDELPNLFNVLRGDMSIIGPRPDAYTHASHFSGGVQGYLERHRVRPGITGLAQVEMGYAEGVEATALKAKYDNMYVAMSCGRLDIYVIRRTLIVMWTGFGAR